jgi:hypothetical protein
VRDANVYGRSTKALRHPIIGSVRYTAHFGIEQAFDDVRLNAKFPGASQADFGGFVSWAEYWRAGPNKTANTYVIEIPL